MYTEGRVSLLGFLGGVASGASKSSEIRVFEVTDSFEHGKIVTVARSSIRWSRRLVSL